MRFSWMQIRSEEYSRFIFDTSHEHGVVQGCHLNFFESVCLNSNRLPIGLFFSFLNILPFCVLLMVKFGRLIFEGLATLEWFCRGKEEGETKSI